MPRPTRYSRYGTCHVIASARLRGHQPDAVEAVPALGNSAELAHISIRVGDLMFYVEDLAAFESLRIAIAKASLISADIFPRRDPAATRTQRATDGPSTPGQAERSAPTARPRRL